MPLERHPRRHHRRSSSLWSQQSPRLAAMPAEEGVHKHCPSTLCAKSHLGSVLTGLLHRIGWHWPQTHHRAWRPRPRKRSGCSHRRRRGCSSAGSSGASWAWGTGLRSDDSLRVPCSPGNQRPWGHSRRGCPMHCSRGNQQRALKALACEAWRNYGPDPPRRRREVLAALLLPR